MLSIDPTSPTPPFEQVRIGLLELIRSGSLAAGARLPTVRAMAEQLGIAPNTVARAYRELEALGMIEGRGRNGTVVSPQGDATEREGRAAARVYVERIRALGVSADEAVSWVETVLSEERG